MVPKPGPPAKFSNSRIDTWSSVIFDNDSTVAELFRSGIDSYCLPIRFKLGEILSRIIRDRDPRVFTALCDSCLPCDHVPPFDTITSGGMNYDAFNIARWFMIDALLPHITWGDDFMPGASLFTILSALSQFQLQSSAQTEDSLKLDRGAYQSVLDRLKVAIALTPTIPTITAFEQMLNGELYTKAVIKMMTDVAPYFNGTMPLYGFATPELTYLLRAKLLLHVYVSSVNDTSLNLRLPQIPDSAHDGRRIDVTIREQHSPFLLADLRAFLRDERAIAESAGSESDIFNDYSSADSIIRAQFETFDGELPAFSLTGEL